MTGSAVPLLGSQVQDVSSFSGRLDPHKAEKSYTTPVSPLPSRKLHNNFSASRSHGGTLPLGPTIPTSLFRFPSLYRRCRYTTTNPKTNAGTETAILILTLRGRAGAASREVVNVSFGVAVAAPIEGSEGVR
jgi:hypothetical protein